MKISLAAAIAALLSIPALAQIGEQPAVKEHLDQADIEAYEYSLDDLFRKGKDLFDARFNDLDGQGRPATTGGGAPRDPVQPDFIRTSGPDATSCTGCHAQPTSGGAGDFVANVFVLAQTLDPVTESVNGMFSNERNTLGMMGAGPIEMLAREMSKELIAIREAAKADAAEMNEAVTRTLTAKGVNFGRITVLPDGKIDPSEIEGVDWDLIVKPFHQKGAVVSLREFTNNAMNHHHGIQSTERFGVDVDPDNDGVMNELTVGDITATTIFQAALNTPGQVITAGLEEATMRGEELFNEVGCTRCHIAEFELTSPFFTEPNPFNPAGNLKPVDGLAAFAFDMTSEGPLPRLEASTNGGAILRPFTDLKRHNINDDELNHFDNEQVPQGMTNGFAPPSDFTIEPQPRSTSEFLTRKLWDCGNTAPFGHRGDLNSVTAAIHFHGGDARTERDAFFELSQDDQDMIITFISSMQILPEGYELIVMANEDGKLPPLALELDPDNVTQCGPFGLFFPMLTLTGLISLRRRNA